MRPFGGVYFQAPINQTLPGVFGLPAQHHASADHLNTMTKYLYLYVLLFCTYICVCIYIFVLALILYLLAGSGFLANIIPSDHLNIFSRQKQSQKTNMLQLFSTPQNWAVLWIEEAVYIRIFKSSIKGDPGRQFYTGCHPLDRISCRHGF